MIFAYACRRATKSDYKSPYLMNIRAREQATGAKTWAKLREYEDMSNQSGTKRQN